MNKRPMWIGLVILICVLVVGGWWWHQATPKSHGTATNHKTVQVATATGKWRGYKAYPNHQGVTMEVQFGKQNSYTLIETNTVSQDWKRIYTGTYVKKGTTLTLTPQQVVVSTYSDTAALKANQPTNTETVVKADFYRQFGNQQTSKATLGQQKILLVHDEERVTLKQIK